MDETLQNSGPAAQEMQDRYHTTKGAGVPVLAEARPQKGLHPGGRDEFQAPMASQPYQNLLSHTPGPPSRLSTY